MPKKKAAAKTDKKKARESLPRAAHEKKRVDGLFNPASSTAPKAPKAVKKKKVVKKKKKVSRKTKPTYLVMIKRALDYLNNRNGSSLFAIYKYLEDNYPVSDSFRRFVSAALKKGVADGLLDRVRLSYKLTSKGRGTIGKASKKKAAKKKSTSSSGSKRKRSTSSTKKDSKKKTSSKKGSKKTKSKEKEKSEEKEKEEAPKKKRAAPTKKAREETSTTTSTSKKLVSPAGHKFRWQYQDGTWKDYEINASDLVETAYQHYLQNPGMCDVRSVKSGQWQYQVDFLNNKQTNIQHENHTTRSIRRLPIDE